MPNGPRSALSGDLAGFRLVSRVVSWARAVPRHTARWLARFNQWSIVQAVDLRIVPGKEFSLPCLHCHGRGIAVEINGVQAGCCELHLSEVGRLVIAGQAGRTVEMEPSAA